MKKLLILTLVLGMTSAASATLCLVQVDPTGADLTINIGGPGGINDGILEGDMYLVVSSDGFLSNYACLGLGGPIICQYIGDIEDFGGLGAPAGFTGEVWALTTSMPGVYPIYSPVMTVLGGAIGDTVALGWLDEHMNSGIIDTIVLVPEPMTLALLGLGGLMLRRRR